jgi:MYXO-CTERM domain-containing protein
MIDNIILNAHNQGIAGEYDVYWDNLASVPSPGAATLLAMGGLIGTRRRR